MDHPVLPAESNQEHFFYLYRDEKGVPVYVGHGREADRGISQLALSHNPGLQWFLAETTNQGKFRIEIAGLFGSEQTARSVETALISALDPRENRDPGPALWRFRPLGVPAAFADRPTRPELTLAEFLIAQGKSPAPVLFVKITDKNFADRSGYH